MRLNCAMRLLKTAWLAAAIGGVLLCGDHGKPLASARGSDRPVAAGVSPVLGSGHGLDHVGIAVRNLTEAEKVFRERLGFTVGGEGKHPGGTANAGIDLKNNQQYIELISVYDRQKAAVHDADLVHFLDRDEGALFLGLDTSSASAAAKYLRAQGLDVDGPKGGSWTPDGFKEQFPEQWKSVSFNKAAVPGNTIFFIEYEEAVWKQLEKRYPQLKPDPRDEVHANGAVGIQAVWMAVRDLKAATAAYERVGLPAARSVDLPFLGARAREIRTGVGSILLVAPSGPAGAAAKFIHQRGEGVMGLTLRVDDVMKTRMVLAERTHTELPVYAGVYGRSVVVPGQLAKGAWIEFAERSRTRTSDASGPEATPARPTQYGLSPTMFPNGA